MVNVFEITKRSSSPAKPPSKRKKGWNQFAQRAKERKEKFLLAAENARLRLENERLKTLVDRLQRENDDLWNRGKD